MAHRSPREYHGRISRTSTWRVMRSRDGDGRRCPPCVGRPTVEAWTVADQLAGALFCLNSFTLGIGGPAETKAIMNSMAWQIRELGLNQQFTASMYEVQEQVGLLYSNFFYSDL